MSFLRIEKRSSGTFMRIVQSYREGGKVMNRTLYSLGKVEDFSSKELEQIGQKFLELSGCPVEQSGRLALREECRYNYGFPVVVKRLARIFGLEELLSRFDRSHRLQWHLFDSLCLMLCDRFQDPVSKLASHGLQQEYIGLNKVSIQHLYRSLDYFGKHQQVIQQHLFERTRQLSGLGLDLVFYDVTTFYFQSDVEEAGALRQMGFGKDGKVGKTQVLFGLLLDNRRNPVGYHIYSGDTYEGHTFEDSVKQLRHRYGIDRVIVVADSGMMNRNNLALFNTQGVADNMEFIVGERLKSLPAEPQNYLCDRNNYQQINLLDDEGKLFAIQYAFTEHKGKKLLATYSDKRARKDRAEREQKIVKAAQLLQKPDTIDRKAKRFYLKTDEKNNYSLDIEKIKRDEKFDGILVLATNALDLTPDQAIQHYKELYNIEQSFRCFKSFIEARPMFHWTDARISGHLCMCYIAFCLLSYLKNINLDHSVVITENNIRRALRAMQLSKVNHRGKEYYLRAALDEKTVKMLKNIGINQTLNDLENWDNIAKYLA